MTKEMIKPFAWGLVAGAIVLLIVVFATGWVTTSSSAKQMAEEKAEEAVTDKLASICVFQFNQDPQKSKKLEELEGVSSWQQEDFVEEQGWATMPGSDSPASGVAEKCAEQILMLEDQK